MQYVGKILKWVLIGMKLMLREMKVSDIIARYTWFRSILAPKTPMSIDSNTSSMKFGLFEQNQRF